MEMPSEIKDTSIECCISTLTYHLLVEIKKCILFANKT
jgi:hypothetical protein